MKKFYSLFMALCLSTMLLNAKTVETTLWEGTYSDGVELNAETVASFKAGDVLRVYVTVPEGGANFKIVYKGAPDWSETTIPSMESQWPWVNGGETYKDITLTEADLTAMTGKNIYVYKGENSTIVKVSLLTEDQGGTTGLGEVQGDKVQSTKVIENGVLYIMYKGTMYDVRGNVVK
jgi:hypothetical protein